MKMRNVKINNENQKNVFKIVFIKKFVTAFDK